MLSPRGVSLRAPCGLEAYNALFDTLNLVYTTGYVVLQRIGGLYHQYWLESTTSRWWNWQKRAMWPT